MTQDYYYVNQLFQGIKLSGLPNNGHGEFTHDVLTRAKATPAIVTNLPVPLATFETAVEAETHASYKDLTESITLEINNVLAPRRNEIETATKSAFRAQIESDDAQISEAAKTLFELAHLHRLHTDMKIDAQTDAIRDFCSDVETNHMEALELTGFKSLFNKLKAANDAVCDAMMRRMDIEAERVTGAMVEARRHTDEAYRGLLRGVDAFAYVQGVESYQSFVSFVNQLIKHYKRIYPNAGSGNSNGDVVIEEEETVEEEGSSTEEGGGSSSEGGSTSEGEGGSSSGSGSNQDWDV